MCGGNLDPDRRDGLSPREQEEFDLLSTTGWCLFLYCFGFGCNSPGGSDACCMVEGKLCCLWSQLETDSCWEDTRLRTLWCHYLWTPGFRVMIGVQHQSK